MAEDDLYRIRDGETLRVLDCGIEIVRRDKHEWKPSLDKLPSAKLIKRTGKGWGSKFYPTVTLNIVVSWIEGVVVQEGWTLQPGTPTEADRMLDRDIGLVAGIATRKIRVVCDGRYAHAYPIME